MRLKPNTYYLYNYDGILMIFKTTTRIHQGMGCQDIYTTIGSSGYIGEGSACDNKSIEISAEQVELYKTVYE